MIVVFSAELVLVPFPYFIERVVALLYVILSAWLDPV